MTQIISAFSEVSSRYKAAFVDLWGCMHNGVTAFPEAVAAMQAFRAEGGTVILVTNAPRPRADVERQIAGFGIPKDAYDSIATSGDSARVAMFQGAIGSKVWFMGNAATDGGFFEPPKIIEDPVTITRVEL